MSRRKKFQIEETAGSLSSGAWILFDYRNLFLQRKSGIQICFAGCYFVVVGGGGGGGGVVVGLVVSGFAASACYKALVAKNRLKTQTNVAQWAGLVDNLDVLGYMLNIQS